MATIISSRIVFVLVLCLRALVLGNVGVPPSSSSSLPSLAPLKVPDHAAEAERLSSKYGKRFVHCSIPQFPHCDVYLCGTLHVAKSSSEMVQDVVRGLKPHFVVLELCESRVDSLYEIEMNELMAINVTLGSVVRTSWQERSFKTLGSGLLTWMQFKAAKVTGSKLGGELTMAAKEGAALSPPSTVVLGDRLYGVTIQRIFDKLRLFEKAKMCVLLLWEVVTMSVSRLKDYVSKTESDDDFIRDEIARFRKHLPTFAEIIVSERDEYIAQTLLEIARVGFGDAAHKSPHTHRGRGRVLAVCGAAHLAGVQRCLAAGGCSEARIEEISSSSRHNSTWPGRGMLQVVNSQALWGAKTET